MLLCHGISAKQHPVTFVQVRCWAQSSDRHHNAHAPMIIVCYDKQATPYIQLASPEPEKLLSWDSHSPAGNSLGNATYTAVLCSSARCAFHNTDAGKGSAAASANHVQKNQKRPLPASLPTTTPPFTPSASVTHQRTLYPAVHQSAGPKSRCRGCLSGSQGSQAAVAGSGTGTRPARRCWERCCCGCLLPEHTGRHHYRHHHRRRRQV